MFAHTAHSFACSGLLASLAPSAALTRLLARSLRSLPRSWDSEFLMSQYDRVLSQSVHALTKPDPNPRILTHIMHDLIKGRSRLFPIQVILRRFLCRRRLLRPSSCSSSSSSSSSSSFPVEIRRFVCVFFRPFHAFDFVPMSVKFLPSLQLRSRDLTCDTSMAWTI